MSELEKRLRPLWFEHYTEGGHSPGELETLVLEAARIGFREAVERAAKVAEHAMAVGEPGNAGHWIRALTSKDHK